MFKYIVKRLIQSVVTLIIVITVVFSLMRLFPMEGYFTEDYEKLSVEVREAILESMGLTDPYPVQLGNFYKDLLKGDLGQSIIYRPKVDNLKIIKGKVKYSLYFGLAALSLSVVTGLTMGIYMARFKGKFLDKLGTSYIVLINAIPAAIYFLLIQLYATGFFKLPILFNESNPKSWILPLVSMSLGSIAGYAMWIRRYMVDELNKDYIKLAMAKGMTRSEIMKKHVLKNAFVPMAQYLPSAILMTVAGSIYVESLYSIPGMGGLLVDVIQRQDNTLVQALVVIYASLGIIGLLLGDIFMATLDPRIKLNKKEEGR